MKNLSRTKDKHSSLLYRPDVDGLRAIAVISVVIYHLFPSLCPSGFVGVDIFFVISGYLISSIIFTDLQEKKFSFSRFYTRRIKRIFPALLLILIFVIIFCSLLCFQTEYVVISKTIKATAIFVTNIRLSHRIGYFDGGADQNPLLHIWSLSLEEQFYIAYPVIVWLLYKRRAFIYMLVIFLCTSFVLNISIIEFNQPAAFYLLHTRAWELLIGAFLAYYPIVSKSHLFKSLFLKMPIGLKRIWSLYGGFQNFFSCIGLSLVVYACIAFRQTENFPGWLALVPTVGTALLIANQHAWFNRRILSYKVLVWIGLISYSLYLWHWPLISFSHIMTNGDTSVLNRIYVFVISVVLATMTTFLIEKPIIRNGGFKTVCMLSGSMCVILLISVAMVKGYIQPLNLVLNSENVLKINSIVNDWAYPTENLNREDKRNFPFPSFGKGEKVVLFFGDSNVEQYWPRVEALLQKDPNMYRAYTVLFATIPGQPPIPGFWSNRAEKSNKPLFLQTLAYLKDPGIDSVVIGADWVSGLSKENEETQLNCYTNLENMLVELKKQKKNVYMILNIPIDLRQGPYYMVKRHVFSAWEWEYLESYSDSTWLASSRRATTTLRSNAMRTGVTIIDPCDTLCINGRCLLLDENNENIYKGRSHLRASYVRKYATFIDRIFQSTGSNTL